MNMKLRNIPFSVSVQFSNPIMEIVRTVYGRVCK